MRTLVVVPTYNEADNIVDFLQAVHAAVPSVDVLVVDDNSPDGTGALAESVAAELGAVKVLHRSGKAGLGAAYRHGFEVAFDEAGLDWEQYVRLDDAFLRPAEVDLLVGDARKAERELGWTPQTSFEQLIRLMVRSDLALLS